MRRKDLSGAHVCTFACWLIVSRISVRVDSWKISGAKRLVMMRVFEGGDGSTSGGKSDRSIESGDLLRDDARERCGDGMVACMLDIMDAKGEDML